MSSTISFISNRRVSGSVALKSDNTAGVKSDTLDLKEPCLGIMVASDGTVAVNDSENTRVSVTLTLKAGVIYPFGIKRIFSTNTSLNNADITLLYGPLR